jgi:hypothetical protein
MREEKQSGRVARSVTLLKKNTGESKI